MINQEKKKAWDKKVITTAKQWQYNDQGSAEPARGSLENLFYAVADALGINVRELNFNF